MVTNLHKLQARRAKLVAEMRALSNAAAEADRDMTAEERTRFAAQEAELASVNTSLDAEQRLINEERARPFLGGPANPLFPDGVTQPGAPASRPAGRNGGKYADLFGSAAGKTDGWPSREAFFKAIHSGMADGRLQAAHFEGVPSTGGFAVPEQFAAELLDESLESEIVRPRADVRPMTTDTKRIAMFDGADHSAGALYGGFTAQWLNEGGAITEKTAKLRMIELNAKKLGLLAMASNELIADGATFEDALIGAMAKAMGWHLDYYFLRGTGAGQPLGVLNDPALVVITKEAGQAAATIMYENVAKMFARMHPALIGDAVWVANPDCIPQLLQLNIRIKNQAATDFVGGSHVAVLSESGGQMRLMTRPIWFTEKLPALGAQGDLLFVNLSQYAVGLRKEVGIEKSGHVGFTSDVAYYRGIIRADGQGKWNQPVKPKAGNSLSWCVALEPR